MKKIFLSMIMTAAIFTGCKKEVISNGGTGSLKVDLTCGEYKVVQSKATDAEIINGLKVDILRLQDGWATSYSPFGSIAGKVIELDAGTYTLTAASPEQKTAEFDQPIYSGTEEFAIKTGQLTSVDLLCSISNVKVSLNLSEGFYTKLSTFTITVSNGLENGTLSWSKNAEGEDFIENVKSDGSKIYASARDGYFMVNPLKVTVDGYRTLDGSYAKVTKLFDQVQAADHHILNIDAAIVGEAGINITINHQVNPIEQEVAVPGFEEIPIPGDPPADGGDNDGSGDDGDGTPADVPYLVWEANPSFSPMNIDDNLNADLVIFAPEKVSTFKVLVDSDVLSETIAALCSYAEDYTGGPAEMDMLNDAVLIENLGGMGLGLPLGDEIRGKTEVPFSLSGLIPLINMYSPEPGAQHKFTLKVTDEKGNSLEQLLIFVSI